MLPHDRAAVDRLARALDVPALVAQLLLNRGVHADGDARRFLDPRLTGLHAPATLPGIPEAADRLMAAIADGRGICVYGDYDVDGVTGSAILLRCLELLGAKPDLHIPHRLEEGYGLNREALRQIAANGSKVVVTVDCGIASLEEAEEAKALGLELIVTDHHQMKATLPDAAVLVHPRLPGSRYPFEGLCGAGVALKLAWALAMRHSGGEKVNPVFKEFLLDAIALASLGVVADVVPLRDENRIMVSFGLNRLREKPPLGIQALAEAAGLKPGEELRASDIGFKLAPRLNAAGRLQQARLAVELLTTGQRERAVDLARHLDNLNSQRQTLEREAVALAKELITAQGRQDDPAFVLATPDWHGGIMGIVAGRLAESYGRPTLIVALPKPDAEGLHGRLAFGSGRSAAGVELHRALAECGDLLVGHGGHAAAAGFRLEPENVDEFRRRFCEAVAGRFPEGKPVPEIVIDAEAPLSALTLRLLDSIDKLEPYGAENRRPVFLAGGLLVQGEPRKVGQGERHLQFKVRQGAATLKCIAWGMADRVEELMSAGGHCCLVFAPKRNEWQGRTSVDMEVIDFQAGAEARLA
ncbi:MAG: single-stranded-DNA-specific exonuclease RecJ [Gemmataceae bacterium]|nr:single-stranded-DNA-specific exonuclease RecJ [Gemmataceae bacterium]